MTRPLPVVLLNSASAMPTNRRPLAEAIIRAAAKWTPSRNGDTAALLLGVEVDDAVIRNTLDPDLWEWAHHDSKTRDGLLIATRRGAAYLGDPEWLAGAPASPVNDDRPILRVPIRVGARGEPGPWKFSAAVQHMPKPKGGALAARVMVQRSHNTPTDLIGADWNLRRSAVAARYPGRQVRGAEVMYAVGRDTLTLGRARPFDLLPGRTGDDHPGIYFTVKPSR